MATPQVERLEETRTKLVETQVDLAGVKSVTVDGVKTDFAEDALDQLERLDRRLAFKTGKLARTSQMWLGGFQ